MLNRDTICPVCGFDWHEPVERYEICECCGTQFGYDDANTSHFELRRRWIERGCPWTGLRPAPSGWNPQKQLELLNDDTGML